MREQSRERRLASARRAPQDERREKPAALDHAAQHSPFADEMLLPDELFERARAPPLGERRTLVGRRFLGRRLLEEAFVCAARHIFHACIGGRGGRASKSKQTSFATGETKDFIRKSPGKLSTKI